MCHKQEKTDGGVYTTRSEFLLCSLLGKKFWGLIVLLLTVASGGAGTGAGGHLLSC